MQDTILMHINGAAVEVHGEEAFLNLSDFLRYKMGKTGTKVVCAEGDCGACTILFARPPNFHFKTLNSCIQPVFNLDGCHVVTVEALQQDENLSEVQKCMVESHGAQCGYCTPGICNSMTYLAEQSKIKNQKITEKQARNFLTGNLCRCTGYEPILKAAQKMDLSQHKTLASRFVSDSSLRRIEAHKQLNLQIRAANKLADSSEDSEFKAFLPKDLESLQKILGKGRIVSGATDLGVQRNKNRLGDTGFISMARIESLYQIAETENEFIIGANATWDLIEDKLEKDFPDFAKLIQVFASPQIKHVATAVGNLVNASPISDSAAFFLVNEASLEILSTHGTRVQPLKEFYLGYKKINLAADEVVTAIKLPKPKAQLKNRIYKVSQRKDLDIASVNCAIAYRLENFELKDFRIAFGGVAATTIAVPKLENLFRGKNISGAANNEASLSILMKDCDQIIADELKPMDDVRGSAKYRIQLCQNLLRKFVAEVQA